MEIINMFSFINNQCQDIKTELSVLNLKNRSYIMIEYD